jgi:hypothetical protein
MSEFYLLIFFRSCGGREFVMTLCKIDELYRVWWGGVKGRVTVNRGL